MELLKTYNFLEKKCNQNDYNFRNMFYISMLDVSPAVVIQAVHLRLLVLLATSQRTMYFWMSPVLPGSAAPYYVAGYVTL